MRCPEHSSQVAPPSCPGMGAQKVLGDELLSCSAVKSQPCHSWQLSRGDIPAVVLVGGSVWIPGSALLLPSVLPSLQDALRGNPASISASPMTQCRCQVMAQSSEPCFFQQGFFSRHVEPRAGSGAGSFALPSCKPLHSTKNTQNIPQMFLVHASRDCNCHRDVL